MVGKSVNDFYPFALEFEDFPALFEVHFCTKSWN